MIKNRTAQLIYQTIYLTLGFVGLVASLGIFDNINTIRWDFYVHFTNISNFLCIGVMLAGLIQTAKKKEVEETPAAPPAPSKEEVLLTEIRDLLKEKK